MAQPPLLENGGEWTPLATNSHPLPPRELNLLVSRNLAHQRAVLKGGGHQRMWSVAVAVFPWALFLVLGYFSWRQNPRRLEMLHEERIGPKPTPEEMP